jgi:hypothetical protein
MHGAGRVADDARGGGAKKIVLKARTVRGILKDKRNRDMSDWRSIDELCLFVGYFLLLGSSVVRLFVQAS